MAKNKFFYKVLIVLSATAIFLTACGSAQPGDAKYDTGHAAAIAELAPGNPTYEAIFAAGKASVVIDQIACQSFINQTSCQVFVDTVLTSVVYDAASCAASIDAAKASWAPSQWACQNVGYGYPAVTVDSSLRVLKDNGYYCYIPVIIAPTATPKPKLKGEGPPAVEPPSAPPTVEPPCLTCPVPPVEEPPCATCPVPPGD